jgi:flagellar biosynthetic protein FliQ
MTDTMIVELGLQAMTIAAKMSAPVLLTALLIGFAISLFQSVTQIQEATLSSFTSQLFEKIPSLLG